MPPNSPDGTAILHLVISAIRGDEYLEENTNGFLLRPTPYENLSLNTRLLNITERPNHRYDAFFAVKTLHELAEFMPEDDKIRDLLRKQNEGI